MAQFDVYENDEPESKEVIPFLLDVQHGVHKHLATRTVIPLVIPFPAKQEAKKLFPRFNILDSEVVMSTPEISGYPVRDLRTKVCSLAENRLEILDAIDFLLGGF